MVTRNRGRFITFEGGEGGGKSTQARRLAAFLKAAGYETVLTREPGGSPGAEDIRSLLVDGDTHRWDALTEAMLHFAARRDHVTKVVEPGLDRGAWVVSDRFADSTLAYQGYGHGLVRNVIDQLYKLCIDGLKPDLTVILDLPVETGLARAAVRGAGGDRYERMDPAFHERLRNGFLEIARLEPGRCVVIDATGPEDKVHKMVLDAVGERLGVLRTP